MASPTKPSIDVAMDRSIQLGQDVEIRVVVSDKLAEHPLSAGSVRRETRTFQVNLAEQFSATAT